MDGSVVDSSPLIFEGSEGVVLLLLLLVSVVAGSVVEFSSPVRLSLGLSGSVSSVVSVGSA